MDLKKIIIFLGVIFTVALLIRFLFFPDNIYFGFDQARDAFAAREIINGQPKILGPPTSSEGLYHGSLYYYLYTPFYLLGDGDPTYIAAFLRVLNAVGVFLVFFITQILFKKKEISLVAALLFAFSFEQSQFAIYLNHPSFGVISALIFYLGLALLIFAKKQMGWVITLLGLGLSIQFEFILSYLIIIFLLILSIFRKEIRKPSTKIAALSGVAFLLSISTYILSEMKFNFRSLNAASQLLGNSEKSLINILNTYLFEVGRMVKYNLVGDMGYEIWVIGIVGLVFIYLTFKTAFKKQLIFLGVWFFSAIIIYIIQGGASDLKANVPLYYPNMAVSISLLIFVAFIINNFLVRWKIIGTFILLTILFNNLQLIKNINPAGSMSEINVQSGMLLSDEKKALDYIYRDAGEEKFAVKAITMPYLINTTWSYLFEWYGQKKYGQLPLWGAENAIGFSGNLKVITAQDQLPQRRYLIIEPVRGIPPHIVNNFLQEESYFSQIEEEKKIGDFIVQKRIRI